MTTPHIPDVDECDQPEEEESQSLVTQLRWLVMIGGLLVAVAIGLVLLGIVPLIRMPTGEVPASPDGEPESETAPDCTIVVNEVSVTPRSGDLDVQVVGTAGFEPVTDTQSLATGDVIRTGEDGVAVVTFTLGAYADLHPDTQLTFNGVGTDVGGCVIDLDQASGRICYVVEEETGFEIHVRSAAGEVEVSDAHFCIEQQDEGWCVGATQGIVTINPETGESLVLDSNEGGGLILGSTSAGRPCVVEDAIGNNQPGEVETPEVTEPLLPSDTPTSTASPTATSTATSTATFTPAPTDTPTPTDTATATATDPSEDQCTGHGGLQWEGDTCVCPGVTTHVIICNDGTKWDTRTEDTCQPDSSCDEGGKKDDGGGGGPICTPGAACTSGLDCGGGICLCVSPCPSGNCCSCDFCPP